MKRAIVIASAILLFALTAVAHVPGPVVSVPTSEPPSFLLFALGFVTCLVIQMKLSRHV